MNFKGVRLPAVAGSFYPSNKEDLLQSLLSAFFHYLGPGRSPSTQLKNDQQSIGSVECFVVPHAGYMYSGPVAAHAYLKMNDRICPATNPMTAIIMGPNHYGIGSGVAVSPSKAWKTPLGEVSINEPLSKRISKNSTIIDVDPVAHVREHSIEVQVPFLQMISVANKDLSIVPISMMLQDHETIDQVSDSVSKAIMVMQDDDFRQNFLVLGSSDLTHYEEHNRAYSNDMKLLNAVLKMDVSELYTVLQRNNVTACGYGPIAVVMGVARRLGKKHGNLLKYATSGDITGDNSSVVGYSAVHFI